MTSSRLNGSSLFAQAYSSLTQGYSYILQNSKNKDGITLDDIYGSFQNNGTANLMQNLTNSTFASYLSSNFTNFDNDGNGTISNSEMSNYTNSIYMQGLTRDQLAQLCMQRGYATETLEEVLNNFDKIDKNHDGRVSESEINAFGIEDEISEKQGEFNERRLKKMSVFYRASSSDDEDNS